MVTNESTCLLFITLSHIIGKHYNYKSKASIVSCSMPLITTSIVNIFYILSNTGHQKNEFSVSKRCKSCDAKQLTDTEFFFAKCVKKNMPLKGVLKDTIDPTVKHNKKILSNIFRH